MRRENKMFSVRQKRDIAEKVQQILRETNHLELPKGEIGFALHVVGIESCWADIRNNGAINDPSVNPHNERQDNKNEKEIELVDYEAKEVVGVQIGATGHKLWICIDGVAVLRVKSPLVTLDDMRVKQ